MGVLHQERRLLDIPNRRQLFDLQVSKANLLIDPKEHVYCHSSNGQPGGQESALLLVVSSLFVLHADCICSRRRHRQLYWQPQGKHVQQVQRGPELV